MNVQIDFLETLRCPKTASALKLDGSHLISVDDSSIKYPVVNGVPVLINDDRSIFKTEYFEQQKNTTWKNNKGTLGSFIRRLTPSISHNLKAKSNFKKMVDRLSPGSKILVVGGSVKGSGIDVLYSQSRYEIVVSDVCFSDLVGVVGDGHDLPFKSDCFDAVVIQSVLEHVLDPSRCVDEIHRVLKKEGLVYAETPFIQQVHMKQYDYTRFTMLGHRRLFNKFEEIEMGCGGGPGMALAWSYRAFIRGFSDNIKIRSILTIFAHWTGFFWKYFDYININKKSASESASFYYFFGSKSTTVLRDEDLIKQYRGVDW